VTKLNGAVIGNGFDASSSWLSMNALERHMSLGQMLLRRGHLTKRQLLTAINEHVKRNNCQIIGEIIIELGYCSEETVNSVIEEQNIHKMPTMSKTDSALCELDAMMEKVKASAERLRSTTRSELRTTVIKA